jgi:hypothetical protein
MTSLPQQPDASKTIYDEVCRLHEEHKNFVLAGQILSDLKTFIESIAQATDASIFLPSDPPPSQQMEGDNQPRYTTKRLHDEIAKARAYGLELAAAYHDDMAAQHAASHANVVSDHHEMMERQHERDAAAIRAIAAPSIAQALHQPRCGVIGWPPLKKAIWDEVIATNLNGGKYISAWEVTERIYAAAQSATTGGSKP